MEQKKILIVGDHFMPYELIQRRMAAMEIGIYHVESPSASLDLFITQEYCLVIIDIRVFNQTYRDLISQMRQAKSTPILILCSSLTPEDKLDLLQSGANAFIEEPFNMDICIAQAYALIQLYVDGQTNDQQDSIIYGTELVISQRYRQVVIAGKPLELTRKEFDLLHHLAKHPGQVFSCEQLYEYVWNENVILGSDSTVKAHIKTLRKKLASAGKRYIQNVWGVGYKFELSGHEAVKRSHS